LFISHVGFIKYVNCQKSIGKALGHVESGATVKSLQIVAWVFIQWDQIWKNSVQ
jgi:hypothetical protein